MATRRSTRERKQFAIPGFVYTNRAVDTAAHGLEEPSDANGDQEKDRGAEPEAMPRQQPETQDKDLPPRKKTRIDFSKNVIIMLGSNTATVPEDLLRARSPQLAALIKDGEDGGPRYVKKEIKPDSEAFKTFSPTYLQLLTCNEVALDPEIEKGPPPLRLRMLCVLYSVCERYEDRVSANLVMPQIIETLHQVADSGEVVNVIHGLFSLKPRGHPLRRLLVDHGCDFWSMSDYTVHVNFLNDAFAELVRRRDESTERAVRLPPAEAAKKYLIPE